MSMAICMDIPFSCNSHSQKMVFLLHILPKNLKDITSKIILKYFFNCQYFFELNLVKHFRFIMYIWPFLFELHSTNCIYLSIQLYVISLSQWSHYVLLKVMPENYQPSSCRHFAVILAIRSPGISAFHGQMIGDPRLTHTAQNRNKNGNGVENRKNEANIIIISATATWAQQKIIEFESGSCHSHLEPSPLMRCNLLGPGGELWQRGAWVLGRNAFCTLRWLEEFWKEPGSNCNGRSNVVVGK